MDKKIFQQLTASKLRMVLLASVALLIIISAGLILLGYQTVSGYGAQVSSTVAVSSSDEKTLKDLEIISKALDEQRPIVEKSKGIIADKSNTYAYQRQIIQDITRYANKAGIQVTSFTFAAAAGTGTASSAPAAAPAPGAATATSMPAGLSPVSITVALSGGVSYTTLYKFLQLLEGNLLHMEIENLNLSRPTGTETASISSLTIRIYTQK